MTTVQFCRLTLRTTHVDAAHAFYGALLGPGDREIVPLPAEAAARGAPAHWLGHLGVDDVERAAETLHARGGTRLGPTRLTGDGGATAIVRDPGAAVVALTTRPNDIAHTGVAWHELYTRALAPAVAAYRDLCEWDFGERVAAESLAAYREFAWHAGGPRVGAFADVTRRPEVHSQWHFHFPVASLDDAVRVARDAGAVALGPYTVQGGARVAVCDDPQGAAFALREAAAS